MCYTDYYDVFFFSLSMSGVSFVKCFRQVKQKTESCVSLEV